MTEITDLDPVDSGNTSISGESLDGAIANMGRMDNTLQAFAGMLGRSIRSTYLRWIDGTDSTKRVALDLSGLPTATTRTWTAPYYSGTLGLVSDIRGQIYGLTLSNNVTDATNDIDIAAGTVVDSTGAVSMQLLSGLTKRADAAWAAGTNQGGRFYTTLVDGSIHFYVIRNPTTGVVDAGFSDNATNPTGGASYPAGFTQYQRVGSLKRVAGVIRQFYQVGDRFHWTAVTQTGTANNPGTSAVVGTADIPTGIIADAVIVASIGNTAAASFIFVLISPLAISDQVPTSDVLTFTSATNTGNSFNATVVSMLTNTSAQFRWRLSASTAAITFSFSTLGWIDRRGAV